MARATVIMGAEDNNTSIDLRKRNGDVVMFDSGTGGGERRGADMYAFSEILCRLPSC